MAVRSFALRFQPTHPQHNQGAAWLRDILLNDVIFWRPHVAAKLAPLAKSLRSDLVIVATMDAWVPSIEVNTPEGTKRRPDCPDGYALPRDGGGVWHFAEGHPWILPNHHHENAIEIIDWILERFLLTPLGEAIRFVDWGFHDWCQTGVYIDGFPEHEVPKALEFRRRFLLRMKEHLGKPVGHNAGSITGTWADDVDGVMVEGHEYGGTPEQIESGIHAWRDRGKEVFYVARPFHEHNGSSEDLGPGSTNHFELMDAEFALAVKHKCHFSWSYGHAYESFWMTRHQERRDDEFAHVSVSFEGAEVSSINASRRIGKGEIILADDAKRFVPDLVAGFDWMRSSPGQSPLRLEGEWQERTVPEEANPIAQSALPWCTGPIYNTSNQSGPHPFSYHMETAPLGPGTVRAIFELERGGVFDVCAWRDGLWQVLETVQQEPGALEISRDVDPSDYVTALALRDADPSRVQHATKFEIEGRQTMRSLGGTHDVTVISIRDRCFGVHCDGYARPFKLMASLGEELTPVPIDLRGGFWGARRERFRFAAVFPHFDVNEEAPRSRHLHLHAVSLNHEPLGWDPVTVLVIP